MQMWPKETHEARKTSNFGRSYNEKVRAVTFILQKLKGERHKICCRYNGKGKGEVHPRTGHEGPQGG
jgi:hypothetical protein